MNFLDISEYDQIPNTDELTRDIRDALFDIVGLSSKNINLSNLFNKTAMTLSKHKIYIPREWFIVFRALITLDGVGRSLGLDIDIFSIIKKNLGSVAKEVLSKETLVEEGLFTSRDIMSSLRILPRHLRWFVKELGKRNYAFEIIHKGHEKSLQKLVHSIIFLAYALMAGICLLCGVLLIDNFSMGSYQSISNLSWTFWSGSICSYYQWDSIKIVFLYSIREAKSLCMAERS